MDQHVQLPLRFDDREPAAPEAGARVPLVRVVEYTPFPRVEPGHRPGVGFTRDLSPGGMGVALREEPREGSLLRVTLREIDGRVRIEALARVGGVRRRGPRSWWTDLSYVADAKREMLRARPQLEQPQAVSA